MISPKEYRLKRIDNSMIALTDLAGNVLIKVKVTKGKITKEVLLKKYLERVDYLRYKC